MKSLINPLQTSCDTNSHCLLGKNIAAKEATFYRSGVCEKQKRGYDRESKYRHKHNTNSLVTSTNRTKAQLMGGLHLIMEILVFDLSLFPAHCNHRQAGPRHFRLSQAAVGNQDVFCLGQ